MGISREDTRRDRLRATKDRKQSKIQAAREWMVARESRRERQRKLEGEVATIRNLDGPVEIIILPLHLKGVEFWLVAAWAAGHAVEYCTRMSEASAIRMADQWEKKYSVRLGGELAPSLA